MPLDIVDPFHRALHKRLSEEMAQRIEAVAGGSASVLAEDTKTVAEKYAAQVAYIMALRDVLEVCEELGSDLYGNARRDLDRDD